MDIIKRRVVTHTRARLADLEETQQAFCVRTGLPYGTLLRALSGRDSGINSQTIISLARAFGVDPGELVAK